MMVAVSSSGGTSLAYNVFGRDGAPTAIWVHGATAYRAFQDTARRVAYLADLRILTYDRRGRGESSDTVPYAVEREIDDIAAVISVLGAPVAELIGESSGAILALEAARSGVATRAW